MYYDHWFQYQNFKVNRDENTIYRYDVLPNEIDIGRNSLLRELCLNTIFLHGITFREYSMLYKVLRTFISII